MIGRLSFTVAARLLPEDPVTELLL